MSETVRKYTNGQVIVVWQPAKCIHSTRCFRGLPQVFDPQKRPWVDPYGASTEQIVRQVEQCPSGALSTYYNPAEEKPSSQQAITVAQEEEPAMADDALRIKVSKNGPYQVSGSVPLARQTIGVDGQGESVEWVEGQAHETRPRYLLCRCGHSGNKPFCDGTHAKVGFDGAETASHAPYLDQARTQEGPTMVLTDAAHLCAAARFCDPNGTVWRQVSQTDDANVRVQFERQVGLCPSGRLVAWDKETGRPVEPQYSPSIGLVQDPANDVSGPLWVRGGIEVVSADGEPYPVRNRQTLCRCGASSNKPFCDGSHIRVGFRDDR